MGIRTAKQSACVGTVLAVASALSPTPVHAAGGGANPAAAESLYEEARGLMKQGKLDQACPKFKQSYDLDPGGGTLLNLAECYEKQGKFASAWSSFKEAQVAAQRDGRRERVEYAKKHIAAVEPKLSKVTIEVPSDSNITGLSVTLDGAELGAAAWNVGIPIDPGSHELAASAPNKTSFDKPFEIAAATPATTLTIPKLADLPVAVVVPAPRVIDHDVEKKPVPSEATAGSGSGRSVGFVLLGAGVVGIGVGSYFGLHAFSKWNERKDGCASKCTPDAKSAGDAASSAALVSDIGFGVGLIAAGVGTYLILSSKPANEANAMVAKPGPARASVQLVPLLAAGGGGLWLRGNY